MSTTPLQLLYKQRSDFEKKIKEADERIREAQKEIERVQKGVVYLTNQLKQVTDAITVLEAQEL